MATTGRHGNWGRPSRSSDSTAYLDKLKISVSEVVLEALPEGRDVSEREVIQWVTDNLSDPVSGFKPDMGSCPCRRAWKLLCLAESDASNRSMLLNKYLASVKLREEEARQEREEARLLRLDSFKGLERLTRFQAVLDKLSESGGVVERRSSLGRKKVPKEAAVAGVGD